MAASRTVFSFKPFAASLTKIGEFLCEVIQAEMAQIFQPMLLGPWLSSGGRKMTNLSAKSNKEDLSLLKDLIEAGDVSPVIDKSFPLCELPEALQYYGKGRSRGKVVVTVKHEEKTE